MKLRRTERRARTVFDRRPSTMLIAAVVLSALIPLLSGGFFYARARQAVKTQQMGLARASVDLGHQYIDTALRELTVTAVRLGGQLRYLSMPPMDALTATDRLRINESSKQMLAAMNSEVLDLQAVYVHSASNGYVVGEKGMYEDALLKKKYYESIEDGPIEALHLTAYTGNLIRLGDRRHAFVRTIQKTADGMPQRQLVLLLRSGFWEKLLREINVSNGVFAITSADGSIQSIDADGRDVAPEALRAAATTGEDAVVTPFSDHNTFFVYRKALSMGEYMLIGLIPMDRLLDGTRMLDIFFWTVMGIAALFVTALLFTATRRSVLPIGKLIEYIASHYTDDGDHSLDQIQRSVERMVEERREREARMETYEDERQQYLLKSMLAGSERNAALRASFDGLNYAVVCYYDEGGVLADTALRELIGGAAAKLLTRDFSYHLVTIKPYAVLILLKRAMTIDEAAQKVEECLAWLDERSAHVLIASVSALHCDAGSLDTAYNEAAMAMEYAFTQADRAVTRFDECEFHGELFLRDWHHIDKQLRFATLVSQGELHLAKNQLAEFFPAAYMDVIPPESSIAVLHLQSLKYQFLHDIDHLCSLLEVEPDARNALIGQILYSDSHRKLHALMSKLFEDMDDRYSMVKDDPTDVQAVKRYILENYKNPLLNVSMIAERFDLSANSLSKLFSRKSDISVLHAIHKVRAEAAASMLLQQPERTIQSIAEAVGYTSLITFNRRFKQFYDVTPSEYRRNHC